METIINIVGLLAGSLFMFLNYKTSKTLLGSFFKKYYQSMLVASLFFFLGWVTEFMPGLNLMSFETAEIWHHILLLLAGIMFVATSLYMPKEADKLMKPQEKI